MMFDKKLFGSHIRDLRLANELKQEDLGNALSVTKATISRIESGDRAPSLESMLALADYFNVSLDYLVGRSDEPERR